MGKKKQKKRPTAATAHRPNSLGHLKQRVRALLEIYEAHDICIPAPHMVKGKSWSSRIYGQDRKKQRKGVERRVLVESRFPQLEAGLHAQGLLELSLVQQGHDDSSCSDLGSDTPSDEEDEIFLKVLVLPVGLACSGFALVCICSRRFSLRWSI